MPQDKADNVQSGCQVPCQLRFAAIRANAVVAHAAGKDPIFIEKVNWSFLIGFVGSREPCARYALRTTEERWTPRPDVIAS